MTFIVWGGIVFAVVGSIGVAVSFLTGVVPTKWPEHPITRATDPESFWGRVQIYGVIAAIGIAVALIGLAASFTG